MKESRTLSDGFRHCSNLMRRIYHHNGPINTRHGQGKLMDRLLTMDGATAKELCQEMRMQPSSLANIVRKASCNGFVVKSSDAEDATTYRVSLTEIGREVAAHRAAANDRVADEMFAELSEDELAQLEGLLSKLGASLETQLADSSDDRRHQHRSMHSRRYDGRCKCGGRRRPKNNQYTSRTA
jgi:DNA-binding MarR family transcriptional regulator